MIRLTVNETVHEVDVADDTPLLWVLRDNLRLRGTKFGCGVGQCGACTVHLNGSAVQSCQLPIGGLDGAEITTIEGLSPDGSHPVQRAWVEEQVPQCGYCQSGQIMTAVSLLASDPAPTEAAIETGMRVNLCRCGTYGAIRRAVRRAAELGAAGAGARPTADRVPVDPEGADG